jgi:SAM-dependent methyltransferase
MMISGVYEGQDANPPLPKATRDGEKSFDVPHLKWNRSQSMAAGDNNLKPSGRYSGDEWKSEIEPEGDYERRRFEKSAEGQKKNRREQEMVREFLKQLPAGARVLDVPAGMGRFTDLILELGHRPISIDLNFGRIVEARKRSGKPVSAVQGDVTQLPLADQSVDAVVCFRLLHHLTPEMIVRVMVELRRVAPRAFVTFYSRHTVKFLKKHLRGKPVSGQYYAPGKVLDWARAAGWSQCRHESPFAFLEILHSIDLQK